MSTLADCSCVILLTYIAWMVSMVTSESSYPTCAHDANTRINQPAAREKTCDSYSSAHRFTGLIDAYVITARHTDNDVKMCSHDVTGSRPYFREPYRISGWQPVAGRPTIVYSAYYELRVEVGGPAVRIIASGLQKAYNEIGPYYCILWYDHLPYPISSAPAEYDRIYPSTLFPNMWVSHFILCPLPDLALGVPHAVSVVSEPCAKAATPENHLKVQNRNHVRKGKFAYCYPTIYNRFNHWEMFVEMIELNQMLGAEHFTIYRQQPGPDVDDVLRQYEEAGIVHYPIWDFPKDKVSNVMCQRASLNDCVYRNMHVYDYVIVSDLDEVFVPRQHSVWSDLMSVLDPDDKRRGVFMFQHAYHQRNKSLDVPSPRLITQHSCWRTDVVVPAGKVRCKSMYRTDRALKVDLHFPYQMAPGVEEHMVDEQIAMLHHYRVDPMETFRKYPERYNYIWDDHMTKYGQQLKKNYMKRLKHMGR